MNNNRSDRSNGPTQISREQFMRLPRVAFVAKGHDPGEVAYVHLCMPSIDQLRDYEQWARGADYVLPALDVSLKEVEQQWPGARTLSFGCTCCCTSDLVEWNECCYCGAILEDHLAGCPSRHDHFDKWSAAFDLFRKGETQGKTGKRCTQRTASGRLGYRRGRAEWKRRFDH